MNLKVIFLASALLTHQSFAVLYDSRTDYSNAANPNGVWTLGNYDLTTDVFTLADNNFNIGGGTLTWQASSLPFSSGSASGGLTGGVDQAADALFYHPGNGSNAAAIRWTAPSAGTGTIISRIDFTSFANQGFDGITYEIWNGPSALLLSGTIPVLAGTGTTFTSSPLSWNAGDTVTLNIGNNGFNAADSTYARFSVDFTPVPEVSSLFLGGMGLLGLALRRKR
jgi:hypothetical protein